MWRIPFISVCFAVLFAGAVGCSFDVKGIKEPVHEASQAITEGTQNIKEGTQNVDAAADKLKDGFTKVKEGLQGLDPAGIKRLLDENATLRQQLEGVRAQLNTLPTGEGRIVLSQSQIKIRAVALNGAFRVRGWIDDPQNEFWIVRLARPIDVAALPSPPIVVTIENANKPNVQDIIKQVKTQTEDFYRLMAQETVKRMLTEVKPGIHAERESDVHPRLGNRTGGRTIYLEITPTGEPSSQNLAKITCVTRRANGSEEVVYENDLVVDQPKHIITIHLDVRAE